MKLRMFAVVFCLLFTAFIITEFDVKYEEKNNVISYKEKFESVNGSNNKESIATKFDKNISPIELD